MPPDHSLKGMNFAVHGLNKEEDFTKPPGEHFEFSNCYIVNSWDVTLH